MVDCCRPNWCSTPCWKMARGLAEPGEFTRRAFLNGRIDLAQAEAVADLIHSRTELALAAANEQLAGKLSQRINQLRDQLMQTLAHVEAHIDFPDEDIAPDTKAQLLQRLEQGVAFMDELLRTANEGQILRRGVRAAIVGRPNAGKSSLLNRLLGHDRAIVSPIPGTTRDTIEETANIRGLPVVFIDTAGFREGRDEIEREGVRRSRESLARAEFILHVLDASEPLTEADEEYFAEFAGKRRILVRNKMDLPQKLALPAEAPGPLETAHPTLPVLDVSCLSGQGIEALKDAIKALRLVRRAGRRTVGGNDQLAPPGRAESRPCRRAADEGGVAHRRHVGIGRPGLADCRQRRRRNRRQNRDRRFARFHLQPVLPWEMKLTSWACIAESASGPLAGFTNAASDGTCACCLLLTAAILPW